MAFEVRTTPDAEEDASAILGWLIEQYAGESGLRWFFKMDAAIASLANYPLRCRLAPENKNFPFEVRELLYGDRPHVYRILFTLQDEVVLILHIRHGRRMTVPRY